MRYSASAGASVSTALCVGVVIDLGGGASQGLRKVMTSPSLQRQLVPKALAQSGRRRKVSRFGCIYLCKSQWEDVARVHIYM